MREHLKILLTAVAMLSIISACEKKENYQDELNDLLYSLPQISTSLPSEKSSHLDSTARDTASDYIYKTDYYSVAAGYDEQIVLNPQTDVIYPGALIKGESVLDGSYVPIAANRKPITLSTSLTGGSRVSITVDDPKLSTVREAVNSLMSQTYDVPPANMGFTIEQAYSETQLKLSLRASYSGSFDLSGGFDYNNKNVKTRLVAKFIQSYYTLDMDLPSKPSDLFDGEVNETLFGTYMPMYVSSVTYGRMALFTIESELDETQVKTFLQGSYASVEASASADFDALMASSTMKVYILGGSGTDAGLTVEGFDAFKNYIREGGNFSKESPGAPISYKLRYIKDNTIGKMVFAASYPIRTAVPRTDNIRFDVDVYFHALCVSVDDWGDDCEMRGHVYSYLNKSGEANAHEHFSAIDMPETSTMNYPENLTTKVTYSNLLQNDTIIIHVNLWEDTDFSFPESYRNYPVGQIQLEDENASGTYDTGNDLILYAIGDEGYIIPRIKFIYRMYRTE